MKVKILIFQMELYVFKSTDYAAQKILLIYVEELFLYEILYKR